jgi:O-antigen ligase
MTAAPTRRGAFLVVASSGAGLMVVALPSLSFQLALVLGAAVTTATMLMARAGRGLDPAWVIVAWIYLLGPIGTVLLLTGASLSPPGLLILAPVSFVVTALLVRPEARERLVLLAPLAFLLVLAGLSLVWSPSPAYGAEKLSVWALTGLLPAAFILVLARGSSSVSWKLIAMIAFAYALGLIAFGGGSQLFPGRFTYFIGNPIWEARAVFVGALVVLFGPFPAIAKVVLAPVMIVAGLLTVSLGPFLGLLLGAWAGVAAILLSADRTDRRVAIGWAALGLGTGLAVLLALIGVQLPEIAALTSLVIDDPNVTGRANFLGVVGSLFTQAPVLGMGIGGFASTGLDFYPHNLVAEVGLELGLIGLLALGTWFALALRGAARSPILVALVVATGVFSLFSGSVAGNVEFWMFSSLAVAMIPIGRRQANAVGSLSKHD